MGEKENGQKSRERWFKNLAGKPKRQVIQKKKKKKLVSFAKGK